MEKTNVLFHSTSPWTSYQPLSTNDIDDEKLGNTTTAHQQRTNYARALLSWAIATILSTLVLITIVVFTTAIRKPAAAAHSYPSLVHATKQWQFLEPHPWNYSSPSPCGSTPETARAAGCHWSAMTFAWYPAACYDAALEAEFLARQEWEWFATEDLHPSTRLAKEAVTSGQVHRAFMTMEYHRTHCIFSARKLYRVVMGLGEQGGERVTDNYILGMGHLKHCERFMLMQDENPPVKGVAKYLDCVRI